MLSDEHFSYIDAAPVAPRGLHPLPQRHGDQSVNRNEVNEPNRQRQGTFPYALAFSEELRTEPEDEEFLYKFHETYTGLLILIINSQFGHETRRDYAEQDLEKMQNIFERLGFQIILMRNLTTKQLNNKLKEVSRENIIQHIGCLACVISSHGSEEAIAKRERDEYLPDHVTVYEHFISTKDGRIRTKSILELFDDNHCRPLQGKPKLFFIQIKTVITYRSRPMSDNCFIDASGVNLRDNHDTPPEHGNTSANHNVSNQRNQSIHGHTSPFAPYSTLEELETLAEDDEFIYSDINTYFGLLIMIINSQFDNESNRDYAQQDLENMQEVFGSLGFQIVLLQNKTTKELHKALMDISRENIIQHIGCLACVISSHGSEEAIGKGERDEYLPDHVTVYEHFISTKDGQFRTKSILEIFDDYHCRPLQGKPKLFFIQACRTRINPMHPNSRIKAFDAGMKIRITHDSRNVQHPNHLYESHMDARSSLPKNIVDDKGIEYYEHTTPNLSRMILAPPVCLNHFLVMFASMPEQVGWSDGRGGWLLSTLHDVFEERIQKRNRFSLMAALVEVNRKVAVSRQSKTADGSLNNMKSVPCMEHKLTKEMYLEPRLNQIF